MKKTLFLSIQSILIITILHFLIKNYLLSLKIMDSNLTSEESEELTTIPKIPKNITMNIRNIDNNEINMENIENFNATNMKKELESYLEEETRVEVISEENTTRQDKIQGSNSLVTVDSSNLINEKVDLDSYFQINKHDENKHYFSKEMAEDILPINCPINDNTCKVPVKDASENVSNYNEWVYNNENIMNGGEIYKGITAYDDVGGGYATYDSLPITSS
jgi:hypothetical protein